MPNQARIFDDSTHITTMHKDELIAVKSNIRARVKRVCETEIQHVHLDVMDALCNDFSRLRKRTATSALEQHQIEQRLEELDQLIDEFKPNPIYWVGKFENRLINIVNESVSEGDCISQLEKELHTHRMKFRALLAGCNVLQSAS